MNEPTGSRAPAIILLTDGKPTDDYTYPLDKLKGNPWFRAGVKVAIAIGDEDTNVDVLTEFTGNNEAVLTVHNIEQLKKIIHTVSVTASQVASQSASVGTSDSTPCASASLQNQVTASISTAIENDADLQDIDQGGSNANSGTDSWENW